MAVNDVLVLDVSVDHLQPVHREQAEPDVPVKALGSSLQQLSFFGAFLQKIEDALLQGQTPLHREAGVVLEHLYVAIVLVLKDFGSHFEILGGHEHGKLVDNLLDLVNLMLLFELNQLQALRNLLLAILLGFFLDFDDFAESPLANYLTRMLWHIVREMLDPD